VHAAGRRNDDEDAKDDEKLYTYATHVPTKVKEFKVRSLPVLVYPRIMLTLHVCRVSKPPSLTLRRHNAFDFYGRVC
jgi:hypothetical protein